LQPRVPRKVLDTYRQVWLRLNSLFPRRLWAMTVEGLRPLDPRRVLEQPLMEDDIVLDPLYVLRCDDRVFRCAPLLQLVMYMLQVYLLSSRTFLSQRLQNSPVVSSAGGVPPPSGLDEEREKLRGALVLTQESAAVQILLEAACARYEDKSGDSGSALVLQEVRSIVCSYIHQAFLKDTTLAKLVHFQGYSPDLLAPVVRGVPSMHIAVGLNWIPELLQLPDIDKQMFAIQLTSHLALQNAMPPTLSISRLAVNTLATLLSVLGQEERLLIMECSMSSLVRIGQAFPALVDDLLHLLVMYGRVAAAHSALSSAPSPHSLAFMEVGESINQELDGSTKQLSSVKEEFKIMEYSMSTLQFDQGIPREDKLCSRIIKAFNKLASESQKSHNLY